MTTKPLSEAARRAARDAHRIAAQAVMAGKEREGRIAALSLANKSVPDLPNKVSEGAQALAEAWNTATEKDRLTVLSALWPKP
jgi:hypothetical protein